MFLLKTPQLKGLNKLRKNSGRGRKIIKFRSLKDRNIFMNEFKPEWEEWLDLNLRLKNCKNIMFQKSLDEGYSYNLIHAKLGIDYIVEEKNTSDTKSIALRTAIKLNARNLEIYKIPNFLTSDECDAIIRMIDSSDLQTSSTQNAGKGPDAEINSYRTSKTCYFYGENNIADIESRISKTLGINDRFAEKMQGQKYEVGQEFKVHTDSFDDLLVKHNNGQRTWTFMIYLNDVEEGGYTAFPYAYFSSKPEKGAAIIWNNLDKNNKINIFSTHCGKPIIKGNKYILTKWFKDTETQLDLKNSICDHHFLPIFHPVGFEKITLKLECVEAIKTWMQENNSKFVTEGNKDNYTRTIRSNILSLDNVPSEIMKKFNSVFADMLTKWIHYKTELTHIATYGIREYLKGSVLPNHYDKFNTHVISAIIHLDSDKPWELYIEDHNFKPHKITMEYGDIVFYESTTCLHGRPTKYEGEFYRNMYIHFKPERW